EPLGECKPNIEFFRALALRMGFEDECFRESADDMIDLALSAPNPWLKGLSRERLEREGHIRLNFEETPTLRNPRRVGHPQSDFFLPYAEGNFRTASGKAELYSETLKAEGLDPVATFIPPDESRHTVAAKEFPLELLARKADNFLNSTFTNLKSVQAMEETDLLEISRPDAEPRGIRDGDTVRVFNRRGEIQLKARVDGKVPPGVVAAKLNWAKLTPG